VRRGILGISIVCLCGCYAISSENDIYGHYELTSRAAKIRLDVNADHSYSETVEFISGPEQRNSGKWRWMGGRVCFGTFLEPKEFKNDIFVNARPQDEPKTVGGAYQLDECLPAGKEYGTTILEINPDGPENFAMVRSPLAHP
jgi:hypothetical protein